MIKNRTSQTNRFEEWFSKARPSCSLEFSYNDPQTQIAWEAWQECLRQEDEYYANKDKPHGPNLWELFQPPQVCHVTGVNEIYSGIPSGFYKFTGEISPPSGVGPVSQAEGYNYTSVEKEIIDNTSINKGPIVGHFPTFRKTDDSGWRLTGSLDY